MLSRLHEVSENRFLAQLLARFQTMQAFYQNEAVAVAAHQDRNL